MYNHFLLKCIVVIAFLVLIAGSTKASDDKKNSAARSPKVAQHLAVIYIPYSPYTAVETTSADLERYLHDAMKSNSFRPNGPFMYDTSTLSKPQAEMLSGLLDTKGAPAKYPSGEAEILIEDQFSKKKIFIDQYGVVKTETRQFKLTATTFQQIHDLMEKIFPPKQPSTISQH